MGDWVDHRECRIGGDFLLIYQVEDHLPAPQRDPWKSSRPTRLPRIVMQGMCLESGRGSKGGGPEPEEGQ